MVSNLQIVSLSSEQRKFLKEMFPLVDEMRQLVAAICAEEGRPRVCGFGGVFVTIITIAFANLAHWVPPKLLSNAGMDMILWGIIVLIVLCASCFLPWWVALRTSRKKLRLLYQQLENNLEANPGALEALVYIASVDGEPTENIARRSLGDTREIDGNFVGEQI